MSKKSLHPALPATFTKENLAAWITANAASKFDVTEKVELTKSEIAELEKKSALASVQIDRLKDVRKLFEKHLKKGTPVDPETAMDDEPKKMPIDVTIPPTAGLEILEANREWASRQLMDGFRSEVTTFYFIPYPEDNEMVCVDIEGVEQKDKSRMMNQEEREKWDKPLLKAAKGGKRGDLEL